MQKLSTVISYLPKFATNQWPTKNYVHLGLGFSAFCSFTGTKDSLHSFVIYEVLDQIETPTHFNIMIVMTVNF